MKTEEQMIAQESGTDRQYKTCEEIKSWLLGYVANLLDRDVDDIDPEVPFERYGLDSAAAISMIGDLEDWLGENLDATVVYDFPSINALAKHLGILK